MVLELTKLEYPIFFIHVAPDHQDLEFKKTDWYPSSGSSSTICYRHLTLNLNQNTFSKLQLKPREQSARAKHTHKHLSISPSPSLNLATLSQSKAISLSQSRYLPLSNLPHSPSPSPSRSRSPSHKVCLAQLACSACKFVCKFVIFMHSLILGFDPGGF